MELSRLRCAGGKWRPILFTWRLMAGVQRARVFWLSTVPRSKSVSLPGSQQPAGLPGSQQQRWPNSSSQGGSQHRPQLHCCWDVFAGVLLPSKSSLLTRWAHFDRSLLCCQCQGKSSPWQTGWSPSSTSQPTGGGTFHLPWENPSLKRWVTTSMVFLKSLFPSTKAIQRQEIIPFCSLRLICVQVGAGTEVGKFRPFFSQLYPPSPPWHSRSVDGKCSPPYYKTQDFLPSGQTWNFSLERPKDTYYLSDVGAPTGTITGNCVFLLKRTVFTRRAAPGKSGFYCAMCVNAWCAL